MNSQNLHTGLKALAKNKPDETAITFGQEAITYSELYNRTKRVAHSLMENGIKKGDHVVLYMRNRLETPEIYYAISMVGAVIVPINYMVRGDDLAALINKSDAKFMFIEPETLESFQHVLRDLDMINVENTVIIGDESTEFTSYSSFLVNKLDEIDVEVGNEDLACLIFSSGTTSLPKGIMLTHQAMVTRALKIPNEWASNYRSVFLITVPLYHSIGFTIMFTLPVSGARLVITREFDAGKALELIQNERVTHSVFVPTQYIMMLNHPNFDKYDYSSLVRLVSGGAPISATTKEAIINGFNCDLSEFFGSTETGSYINLRPESVLYKTTSIGQQSIDAEVRLVDENGKDVGIGEGGEFVMRSSILFSGYYNEPEETEKSFVDGWFLTGDMGMMDEEGYYYLLDRKKDMIISGGVNIYSKDIEEVLFKHPAVLEAAVIGVPDELWGESVKAYVVLKDGQEISEEDLITQCNERLNKYQRIKELEFIEEFPKNPSGKILKRVLREKSSKTPR